MLSELRLKRSGFGERIELLEKQQQPPHKGSKAPMHIHSVQAEMELSAHMKKKLLYHE